MTPINRKISLMVIVCLSFLNAHINGCASYNEKSKSQIVEYGCWCKNYRLIVTGEEQIKEKMKSSEAVDDWDYICKTHVLCYMNSTPSTWQNCDTYFLAQVLGNSSEKSFMPLAIKDIFDHYWIENYHSEPPENLYDKNGDKVYYYLMTRSCSE